MPFFSAGHQGIGEVVLRVYLVCENPTQCSSHFDNQQGKEGLQTLPRSDLISLESIVLLCLADTLVGQKCYFINDEMVLFLSQGRFGFALGRFVQTKLLLKQVLEIRRDFPRLFCLF